MILSEDAPVAPNSKTVKYYLNLGYDSKVGKVIKVRTEHLTKGYSGKIIVRCDLCGFEFERSWSNYLRSKKNSTIDTCSKCKFVKAMETNICRYGVENPMKNKEINEKMHNTMLEKYGNEHALNISEFKERQNVSFFKNNNVDNIIEKKKNTCLDKYGFDSYSKTEEFKEKVKETSLKKYGVSSPNMIFKNNNFWKNLTKEEKNKICEKRAKSFYKNGNTQKTSSQQLKIYEMLKSIYDNVELNYPVSYLSLDCMVELGENKFDIEYDGWYWHKDKSKKDFARDVVVKNMGYKVIRIKSRKIIPSLEQIEDAINYMIKNNKKFYEIKLNDWGD